MRAIAFERIAAFVLVLAFIIGIGGCYSSIRQQSFCRISDIDIMPIKSTHGGACTFERDIVYVAQIEHATQLNANLAVRKILRAQN